MVVSRNTRQILRMANNNETSTIAPWEDPSLPAFHAGQAHARDGNILQALKYFEQALWISKKQSYELDEGYNDWIRYVEATMAYLQGDKKTLQSKISYIKMNADVVKRLMDGLDRFGTPNYARDY